MSAPVTPERLLVTDLTLFFFFFCLCLRARWGRQKCQGCQPGGENKCSCSYSLSLLPYTDYRRALYSRVQSSTLRLSCPTVFHLMLKDKLMWGPRWCLLILRDRWKVREMNRKQMSSLHVLRKKKKKPSLSSSEEYSCEPETMSLCVFLNMTSGV